MDPSGGLGMSYTTVYDFCRDASHPAVLSDLPVQGVEEHACTENFCRFGVRCLGFRA